MFDEFVEGNISRWSIASETLINVRIIHAALIQGHALVQLGLHRFSFRPQIFDGRFRGINGTIIAKVIENSRKFIKTHQMHRAETFSHKFVMISQILVLAMIQMTMVDLANAILVFAKIDIEFWIYHLLFRCAASSTGWAPH